MPKSTLSKFLVGALAIGAVWLVFSTYQSIMGPSDATRDRIRQIQGK